MTKENKNTEKQCDIHVVRVSDLDVNALAKVIVKQKVLVKCKDFLQTEEKTILHKSSRDIANAVIDYAVKELLNLHIVSNPLPTKEEVIAEGDKQIEDWLSENHYKEQRAYRVAFRRSYEYVLRFIK